MNRAQAFEHFLNGPGRANYPRGTVWSWRSRVADGTMKVSSIVDLLLVNGYKIIEYEKQQWVTPGSKPEYKMIHSVGLKFKTSAIKANNRDEAIEIFKEGNPNTKNVFCYTGANIKQMLEYLNNEHFEE